MSDLRVEPPGDGALVKAAFAWHAESCSALGSPFMGRLCRLFATRLQPDGAVTRQLWGWPGIEDPQTAAVPLRIAGSLHALVLDRRCVELAAVYPPHDRKCDDDALWHAVSAAMAEHADFILSSLTNAPQTNEVSRAAMLVAGFLTITTQLRQPLILSEVGASAGLNLHCDRFGYRLGERSWGDARSTVQLAPQWSGPPPPRSPLRIASRAGCDLAPIDPDDPRDATRLLSYVWADQRDRLVRTRAALAIAAGEPLRVARAHAAQWLDERLAAQTPGRTHVVFHTIVWRYLSEAEQARCEQRIRAAGAAATASAPLAWLRFEPDGKPRGGALMLTLWPQGEERTLARADFHGRWVEWSG